jgi:hypothetical protein
VASYKKWDIIINDCFFSPLVLTILLQIAILSCVEIKTYSLINLGVGREGQIEMITYCIEKRKLHHKKCKNNSLE